MALDAEHLVPFSHAFAARERADFELAGIGCDSEMGDEHIFGFSRAGGDNRPPAGSLCGLDTRQCFCDRANLIQFDQNGLG